jgi:Protein of unknown function (DUF1592)/Protein of unknown function (DUF1588)/Protein of unknown function (DUF1587)/Protein of unknown function (DUF1595)/Protein of unknown function (DUF1585)
MLRLSIFLCLFAVSLVARADVLAGRSALLPVMERLCLDCHDGDGAKGDLDLAAMLMGDAVIDLRLWAKVEEQLAIAAMPPKQKQQPTPGESDLIRAWIREAESHVRASVPVDPGLRLTRRLTKHEYEYSLRDLLGEVDDQLDTRFPNDGAGGEGFDNTADTLFVPALYVEKYLSVADDVLGRAFASEQGRKRLGVDGPADAALRSFATRAYRRPVTAPELAALLGVYTKANVGGQAHVSALRVALKAVLMSPSFLFLQESEDPVSVQPLRGKGNPWGAEAAGRHEVRPWRLVGNDLAQRLSYFLWSGPPDETLRSLAGKQRLGDQATLAAEVRRMLADPKAMALSKHFAGQWLRLDDLFNESDPDRGKFGEFNDELRQSMYDEALIFADHILRGQGRVIDFLDANYSFINEPLAWLYGVPDFHGREFHRVSWTNDRRGGLLGMAAILTVTAYPQRTSPVLRGKWVLETLLGTPAPPPPADVGQLPEDDRKLEKGTFRQTLEHHRDKPACMGCHRRMDPPGFGLENFNAIGKWRDDENGKPIDATGTMADGLAFAGPAQMRQRLLAHKNKFARQFCTRLLGYALGRGLEPIDQPTLLRLEQVLIENDWRAEPLIIAIVTSYPFTHRR